MNAHTKPPTHPSRVQPAKRFKMKIGTFCGCLFPIAAIVGMKYTATPLRKRIATNSIHSRAIIAPPAVAAAESGVGEAPAAMKRNSTKHTHRTDSLYRIQNVSVFSEKSSGHELVSRVPAFPSARGPGTDGIYGLR